MPASDPFRPAPSAMQPREALSVAFPLRALRGISAKRAELLEALGVHDQVDLLFHYPRAYDDWSRPQSLREIRSSGLYTFLGTVANRPSLARKGHLAWLKFRVLEGAEAIELTFFNQPWLKDKFQPGETYLFHGNVEMRGPRRSMVNPSFLSPDLQDSAGILPIYALRKGLTQKIRRDAVAASLSTPLPQQLTDPLPSRLRQRFHLASLPFALSNIHRPHDAHELELARSRLAFDELYLMRALSYFDHSQLTALAAPALQTTEAARRGLEKLRASLPFQLTKGQMEAINAILRDLRQPRAMNRLLEGDVGSGKTLVAIFAMAYAALCGGQALLMAPTAILAAQHGETVRHYLEPLGLGTEVLLGATRTAERRDIFERLALGQSQIVVGTHALLEAPLPLPRLALTITDEQQRFGVRQRSALGRSSGQGLQPHRLLMSATPIPRTLAMVLYSDMSLSVMKDMPSGRQPVITKIVPQHQLSSLYAALRETLRSGGQIYVIAARIEEQDESELASVETVYRQLADEVFAGWPVGLLHGQMKAREKDQMMTDFLAGRIRVLVSTTVVEVGVDNPRANVMVILNAERFGLAQLHQLRGRVGRGQAQSYCYLVSPLESAAARERLTALERFHDGFTLAEEDLRLRGPGDFFGTRQSGLPSFQLLRIQEDGELFQKVEEAYQLLREAPAAERRFWEAQLQRALAERYPLLGDPERCGR